jgi:hydrogenase maturation factor/predicted fused transcriptional regulator/phosphomethylpyrimidine kinase
MEESIEMQGRMKLAVEMMEDCEAFSAIIPEVRSNFVYCRAKARDKNDVLAVEGRITVVGGRPQASGPIRFGASSHMARFIIRIHEAFPSVRAGINFANDPKLTRFLEEYCRQRDWLLVPIDRSHEPDEIKEEEEASMPWKAGEVIRLSSGRAPKMIYENGAIGKEPVTAILGEDPLEVAEQMCSLANAYRSYLNPPPTVGKVQPELLKKVLNGHLGALSDKVVVPPRAGIDAGVVDIGDDKVMIIAEDPIFTLPGLSLDFFGWVAVHIGASDVAVMGVDPQFMTYSLLLPPGTSDTDLETIVGSIHSAASDLGIAIVGGHTGYYPGIGNPTIGGITVFSFAPRNSFVTPAGAKPGDDVLVTKGPAIESSGVLGVLNHKRIASAYGHEVADKAAKLCDQITVVKDARMAMRAGGVSAMHDATEGGLIGGLFEVAEASGVGMEIDERRIVLPEEVRAVCELFEIDPLMAISEGTLIITSRPDSSASIISSLASSGIECTVVGKVSSDAGRRVVKRLDGSTQALAIPKQDPFWPAFFRSLAGGP